MSCELDRSGRRIAVEMAFSGVAAASVAIGLLLASARPVNAADGDLDPSFGTGGRFLTPPIGTPGGGNEFAYALLRQADGQLVVAGETDGVRPWEDFALVRLSDEGAIDTGFGVDGQVTTAIGTRSEGISGLVEQSDGKLVVGGYSQQANGSVFALARYDPNGTLDPTFGVNGIVRTDIGTQDGIEAVALQVDGKIIAAGYTGVGSHLEIALARYNTDGTLDPDFGDGGVVITALGAIDAKAQAVLQQADGKLAVAGYVRFESLFDSIVLRYEADGRPDDSFGTGGVAVVSVSSGDDRARALIEQPDGKLVTAGEAVVTFERFALVRFNTDGSLDAGFGVGGIVTTSAGASRSSAHALDRQPDGKLVAAGSSDIVNSAFAVVRYNQDGSLDSSFSGDGIVVTQTAVSEDEARAVVALPDGRIVAAGFARRPNAVYDMVLVAYGSDGAIDSSFGDLGIAFVNVNRSNDVFNAMIRQADGRLVAIGKTRNGDYDDFLVVRYDTDGTLDPTFGSGGWVLTGVGIWDDVAYGVVEQSDGKLVVVGGVYSSALRGWDVGVVRYQADGSLDPTFSGDGKAITEVGEEDDVPHAVVEQSDGKITVAGWTDNGYADFALVRYDASGALDPTFGDGGIAVTVAADGHDVAYAVLQQPDGKLVAAGYGRAGTRDGFALVRYEEDGSADASFGVDGRIVTDVGGGQAYALLRQADGRLVAGGRASSGFTDFALVRYGSDGSLDTTFGAGGKVVTPIGPSTDRISALGEQGDGKLVAAGVARTSQTFGVDAFAVARYQSNGGLDESFGVGGKLLLTMGTSDAAASGLIIQPDADLVAGGWSFDGSGNRVFSLARLQVQICGNALVEGDEQCDDGADNGTERSCCDTSCAAKPDGAASCDGNSCTRGDTCAAGVCHPGACAEGQICMFCGEICVATGASCECRL